MEYHNDRFVDASLLVFKEGKLVAVIPANREGDVVHSHQGLTYGGFITSEVLKLKDAMEVFQSVLKHFENNGISSFNLKLIPSIYTTAPSEELLYFLSLLQARLTRRDVLSVIDYSVFPKVVSNNRKRGLKRAKSKGLIVKEETLFDGFWDTVLTPNLKEKYGKAPVHSLEEIKKLRDSFPKQIRQFNVYYEDAIVAGTTIFETETVAHAQYISATENKQELGSLDILFHHLINEVYKDKNYFDFGVSNENQGKNINEGLLYWKESFGARTIIQDFYSLETHNHYLLDQVLQ